MKTSNDPRHQKRQHMAQLLFAQSFPNGQVPDKSIQHVLDNLNRIDERIHTVAPDFPIVDINKTDLAILRLAVYELTVEKSAPVKVIIDEAIELAKEFGGDTSPSFINGALGKLIKNQSESVVSS